MFPRLLDLAAIKHSLFLLGPRQVGKTHLIQQSLAPDLYIDLLRQPEYLRYGRDVTLLSHEVTALARPAKPLLVVIDEIQRHPELLNEVHAIMESGIDVRFVLTGSSARKLRRAGVNLLGGRAVTCHLYPLTQREMGTAFSLPETLRFGSLPKIVSQTDHADKQMLLQSYVETYLKEEIQQEALTRNVPAFARFLELAAFENGNLLNFNNLAREIGVHAKTIKDYFQILDDTLLGFFLYPFARSHRDRIVAHPKFYFFDPGVVRALRRELTAELLPSTFPYGQAFEHWCLLEIQRRLAYARREVRLSFFRTNDGAEVDLLLEFPQELWAIEIKSSTQPAPAELRGLRGFVKDHPCRRAICLCQTPRPYRVANVDLVPWQDFLEELTQT